MFTIVLVVGLELNYGLLLGTQDFFVYNALRFAQPLLTAVELRGAVALDALTVESALIAPTVGAALVLAVGMARAVARIGVGRPGLRARADARSGTASAARARPWRTT